MSVFMKLLDESLSAGGRTPAGNGPPASTGSDVSLISLLNALTGYYRHLHPAASESPPTDELHLLCIASSPPTAAEPGQPSPAAEEDERKRETGGAGSFPNKSEGLRFTSCCCD